MTEWLWHVRLPGACTAGDVALQNIWRVPGEGVRPVDSIAGTGQITISNQCCTYSGAVAVYSRTEAMVEALVVP